jgi:prophage regulatory protein
MTSNMPQERSAPVIRDRRKDRLLRLPAVRERTGLSTPTIYRRQADGTFPKSVKIGLNAVAWYESDIDEFVASPFPG